MDDGNQNMVVSYLNVRFAIGLLAGLLPVLVLIIHWVYQTDMQESISAFYHVPQARNWFVSVLCCVSVSLLCYRGYSKRLQMPILSFISETTLHRMMGVAAFGVGMLPTTCFPQAKTVCPSSLTPIDIIAANCHLICAFSLFFCMALVALFYFPNFQSQTKKLDLRAQKINAAIYRVCGGIIVLVGGVWAILKIFQIHSVDLFWVEFICVWAFGIAWLAKSHFIRRALKQI